MTNRSYDHSCSRSGQPVMTAVLSVLKHAWQRPRYVQVQQLVCYTRAQLVKLLPFHRCKVRPVPFVGVRVNELRCLRQYNYPKKFF
jgi:hypothetical protein